MHDVPICMVHDVPTHGVQYTAHVRNICELCTIRLCMVYGIAYSWCTIRTFVVYEIPRHGARNAYVWCTR